MARFCEEDIKISWKKSQPGQQASSAGGDQWWLDSPVVPKPLPSHLAAELRHCIYQTNDILSKVRMARQSRGLICGQELLEHAECLCLMSMAGAGDERGCDFAHEGPTGRNEC
eukprot:752001-Hanusia_phi.AAC.2